MTWWQALLLLVGGAFAGVVNSMAGGGSMITVPLLVLAGVPGNDANGSNRVGILASSAAAVVAFRQQGVDGLKHGVPALGPAAVGALIGAVVIGRLSDGAFETVFGWLLIPLVLLTIFSPSAQSQRPTWSKATTVIVFFFIGIYAGAVQAGVGLVMIATLSRAGFDLVMANSIKVLVNLVMSVGALAVFVASGSVRWGPALVLAVGLSFGAWIGARLSVIGGEKWIRVLMVVAVLALAVRMIVG